jgi:hypothetical protein
MTHYYKLAFTTFRIIGSLITIYSLLSSGYVLLTVRYVIFATADNSDAPAAIPSTTMVIAKFLPVLFYLLLGVLIFAFSKQLAKLTVKGIDRE